MELFSSVGHLMFTEFACLGSRIATQVTNFYSSGFHYIAQPPRSEHSDELVYLEFIYTSFQFQKVNLSHSS